MEWTTDILDRLYDAYKLHIDRLRTDVAAANRSLGSAQPTRTKLKLVTRLEFEELLRHETGDAETRRLWVRRILRGREHEFPELAAKFDIIVTRHAGGCRKIGA